MGGAVRMAATTGASAAAAGRACIRATHDDDDDVNAAVAAARRRTDTTAQRLTASLLAQSAGCHAIENGRGKVRRTTISFVHEGKGG